MARGLLNAAAINWAELAIVAPLGLLLGFAVGLLSSSRYALVRRDQWAVIRRTEWDRLQDRDATLAQLENGDLATEDDTKEGDA
jgi:hypothetical protein